MAKYYVIQSTQGWVCRKWARTEGIEYHANPYDVQFNAIVMKFESKQAALQYMHSHCIDGIIHKLYYNE